MLHAQGCASYNLPVSGLLRTCLPQGCGQTQLQSSEVSPPGGYFETTFDYAAMPPSLTCETSSTGDYFQQLQSPIAASPAKEYTCTQMPENPPAKVPTPVSLDES